MSLPEYATIVEVGPRDGLQNEKQIVPTEIKIKLINELSATGLPVIEATSFVSPKWIPQLADGTEVLQGIRQKPHVRYPVLVPNKKGLENAIAAGAREIAVFTTPSEQFSTRNTNCSVSESLQRIADLIPQANNHDMRIRAYISCVLGCPYEGEIPAHKVVQLASQLIDLGCNEISLGDTIGIGTPFSTQVLLQAILEKIPVRQIAVHFHDTYGMAIANIYTALSMGIHIFDSSVAGLGGCPYAKGATGNVATEDVVYLLSRLGVATDIDLQKLIKVGQFISKTLNRSNSSKVSRALSGE